MNKNTEKLSAGKFLVEHISKIYENETQNSLPKQVLKDINLEISANEITVIVGKSGCGKTTFLRILAGLENISEGQIRYLNSENKEKNIEEIKIGMVFQEPRLMPWLTVEKNIKIHENKKIWKTLIKLIQTKFYLWFLWKM